MSNEEWVVVYRPGPPNEGDTRSAMLINERLGYRLIPVTEYTNEAYLNQNVIFLGGHIANPHSIPYFGQLNLRLRNPPWVVATHARDWNGTATSVKLIAGDREPHTFIATKYFVDPLLSLLIPGIGIAAGWALSKI